MQKIKSVIAIVVLLASTLLHGTERESNLAPPSYSLCVACHGIGGNSFKPHYPKLAAQDKAYLYKQLINFKEGKRYNPEMSRIVANLSIEDIDKLTSFFSNSTRIPEEILTDGSITSDSKVKPAISTKKCFVCHESSSGKKGNIPYIKGQQYFYILKQLQDFKSGTRIDSSGQMTQVVLEISDTDLQEISKQISQQQP